MDILLCMVSLQRKEPLRGLGDCISSQALKRHKNHNAYQYLLFAPELTMPAALAAKMKAELNAPDYSTCTKLENGQSSTKEKTTVM